MIDIVIGLVVGAVAVFFLGLLPYQTLRREHRATQAELAEIQSKNSGLQADLLDAQSGAYQSRQAALQQQKQLEDQLAEAGYIGEVAFFPNLSRAEKIDFLRGLTVFSVPALITEAQVRTSTNRSLRPGTGTSDTATVPPLSV